MINKVLGKKIFKPNTHESTATICKIRNSAEIKIVAEHLSGETSIIHLPDTCELETETGEKMFRETLGYFVDKPESEEGIQYRSIDIGFPIEMLKVLGLQFSDFLYEEDTTSSYFCKRP